MFDLGAPVILVRDFWPLASGVAVAPFLVASPAVVLLLFFFLRKLLDSTTFHSPFFCSLGSDVVWVIRRVAEWLIPLRASRLCCRTLKRSSIALIMERPISSTLLSRAASRALPLLPFRAVRSGSDVRPLHHGHSWAQAAIFASSLRRVAFSSSSMDSLASTSFAAPVLLCVGPAFFSVSFSHAAVM